MIIIYNYYYHYQRITTITLENHQKFHFFNIPKVRFTMFHPGTSPPWPDPN